MDKNTYEKYVTADCWRFRRDALIHRFQLCELCGHNKSVQVHHLTYERLGCELDMDLAAVCESCHKAIHGLEGGTPITWIVQFVTACLENTTPAFKPKYHEILKAVEKLKAAA